MPLFTIASTYATYRRCDGERIAVTVSDSSCFVCSRRFWNASMAALAVLKRRVKSIRLAHSMPVRPVPPLQCTASTFSGSSSSHALASSQKWTSTCSGGACLSFIGTFCTCSPRSAPTSSGPTRSHPT
eukprot:2557591-Rhodomonas_salina.5